MKHFISQKAVHQSLRLRTPRDVFPSHAAVRLDSSILLGIHLNRILKNGVGHMCVSLVYNTNFKYYSTILVQ